MVNFSNLAHGLTEYSSVALAVGLAFGATKMADGNHEKAATFMMSVITASHCLELARSRRRRVAREAAETETTPQPKRRHGRPKKKSPSRRNAAKWRLRIYNPNRPKQSGGSKRKRNPK